MHEDDLCVRAARLLQAVVPEAAGRGVTITLHKTIPPGSGLGGGSSNAATTLLALNHLWQLRLTRERLAALGLQLGADVPVFVHGRAARASGIGEVLVPCDPAEQWLCVCLPPVNVSTARVFSHPQLRRTAPPPAPPPGDLDPDKTGNDLEPVTALLYPQVADALAQLRRYGNARLSGSGAAVYAGFDSRKQAEHAAAQLPGDLRGLSIITRSRNRHPLVDFPDG